MTDMGLSQESIRVRSNAAMEKIAALREEISAQVRQLSSLQQMCRHNREIHEVGLLRYCDDCQKELGE